MDQKKHEEALSGKPIAAKLISMMKRRQRACGIPRQEG